MHLEILVEDQSGKKALDILVPKIIGYEHTFRVLSYKGIGRIPPNLKGTSDASKRILLDQLPRLLRGYGNAFASNADEYSTAVIVVCDLDQKCLKGFREELLSVLSSCHPAPDTRFCIAVEEGEAWFLGDVAAVKAAYPTAKENILSAYKNDDICGTWERLADAVYPGGFQSLSAKGWQAIGAEKTVWSEKIAPHMNPEENASPSFSYFVGKLRSLVGERVG
jgi:hypothetical protein